MKNLFSRLLRPKAQAASAVAEQASLPFAVEQAVTQLESTVPEISGTSEIVVVIPNEHGHSGEAVRTRKRTPRQEVDARREEATGDGSSALASETLQIFPERPEPVVPVTESASAAVPETIQETRQVKRSGKGGKSTGQHRESAPAKKLGGRSGKDDFPEEEIEVLEPLPGKAVGNVQSLTLDVPLVICWREEGRVLTRPGVYVCLDRPFYGVQFFHLIRWEDRPLAVQKRSQFIEKLVLSDVTMLRIVEAPVDLEAEVPLA